MFKLSERSHRRLRGVHPALAAVVKRAIELTEVDFGVLEGVRTEHRQRLLFDRGASSTLNSRHLTGHAVDLGAYMGPELRWDWPLYHKVAEAMKAAAFQLNIALEWGGDWKTFKDGPHFQLPWSHRDEPLGFADEMEIVPKPDLELKR